MPLRKRLKGTAPRRCDRKTFDAWGTRSGMMSPVELPRPTTTTFLPVKSSGLGSGSVVLEEGVRGCSVRTFDTVERV